MTNNELEAAKAFMNDILVASGHTTKNRRKNLEVLQQPNYLTNDKSPSKRFAVIIADIVLAWLDIYKSNPEMLLSVMIGQEDTHTPEGASIATFTEALRLTTSFFPTSSDHSYSFFDLFKAVSNLKSTDCVFYSGLSEQTGKYITLDSSIDIARYICIFLKLSGVSLDNGKLYNAWAIQALFVDDSEYSFYRYFALNAVKYGLFTSGIAINSGGRLLTPVEIIGGPKYMKPDPDFDLDNIITDYDLIDSFWGTFSTTEDDLQYLYYHLHLEDISDIRPNIIKFDLPQELDEALERTKDAKVLCIDINYSLLNVPNADKDATAAVVNFINTNLPQYHIYDNRGYNLRSDNRSIYLFISK